MSINETVAIILGSERVSNDPKLYFLDLTLLDLLSVDSLEKDFETTLLETVLLLFDGTEGERELILSYSV